MSIMKDVIKKLVERRDLDEKEAMEAMSCIMEGEATHAQIAGFITALRMKGETIGEITGCAKVMREKSEKINLGEGYFIDTCGTGGDNSNSFNISTAAAFVAAAGGVVVAKHGNRSVSSMSGSADVLEALGVNISLEPDQVRRCIEKTGIGFMFAPAFHKSMKHAAAPRRELGVRTIFNMLGPLTNPANAKGQVLGVFDGALTGPVAHVLGTLGVERAMVVHGMDGMDEITTAALTKVSELRGGTVSDYMINPEEFGVKAASASDLKGGDPKTNAEIILSILGGAKGPARDIVLINAAAALYVGKAGNSLKECVGAAGEILDSGGAKRKLEELKAFTSSIGGVEA